MTQSHLNGAYYGPSIPPRTSRSVGRGSGCGPCCLLGTLFNCIFSIIITIIVFLGIIVLVLWLVFRPNKLEVHVEGATLSQFNLANITNNLQYNLTLDMSVRNPNKRIGLDFDYIEADAYYDGNRFGFQQLSTYYQGHKSTARLQPLFEGTQVLGGGEETYQREKGEGYFYIDVKLYTRLKLKVLLFKLHRMKPEIDCRLKFPVPVPVPGTNGTGFERTKCDVRYF